MADLPGITEILLQEPFESVKELCASLLAAMPQPVFVLERVDGNGFRFVVVNPAFERLTGYSRMGLLGACPSVLEDPQGRFPGLTRVVHVVGTTAPWAGRLWHMHKTQGLLWQDWELTALPMEGHRQSCYVMGIALVETPSGSDREGTSYLLEENTHPYGLDELPIPVWLSDSSGAFCCFNRCWLTRTGRRAADSVGYQWMEMIHPDDRASYWETYWAAFQSRRNYQIIYRLYEEQGVRWIMEKGTPRYDTHGQFMGYLGSWMDLTGVLPDSDGIPPGSVNSEVVVNSPAFDGMSQQFKVLMKTNERLRQELNPGNVSQDPLKASELRYELVEQPPRTRVPQDQLMRRLAEVTSQTFDYETILNATAEILVQYFETCSCMVIFQRAGSPEAPVVARKSGLFCPEAEGFREGSEGDSSVLMDLFDHLHRDEPLARVIHVAPLQEPQLKLKTSIVLDKETGDRFTAEQCARVVDTWPRGAMIGVEIQYQGERYGAVALHDCNRQSGWLAHEEDVLTDVANHLGRVFYQSVLYQQANQAKRDAEEDKRRKDRMLANVIHEFRTPLHAIIGFSELMEKGIGGMLSPKQSQYVESVGKSAHHLLQMVNDLLDIAKIDSEQSALYVESIAVRPVLNEVKAVLEQVARQRRITLVFEMASGMAAVKADSRRLRQIFYNLISNAIKYNHEGGQVTVRITRSQTGREGLFSVADNGIGIPQEELQNIFQEFYQVHWPLARRPEGTGLGLSLTKKLVEAQGGRLWVESQEGAGSTFWFTLPLA